MINYFNIIRWKNLLFIALIQWLMQHTVVFPILQTYGFETEINTLYGYLMLFSTVLIAAGGYVINDYFDVKIDRINKPQKVIVTEKISKKAAMLFYQILTGIGILGGILLSLLTNSFLLSFIFIIVPGMLWFYAASYKRQFIWGNVVVSFLSALVILSIGILEVSILKRSYGDLLFQTNIPKIIYSWIGGFAFFAFITTWIREIIKDIQDETGDREMECRTMPIKWGVKKTKYFIYGLIILTLSALLVANFTFIPFDEDITLQYIIFGLVLPLAGLAYLIFVAKTPEDYKQTAALTKFIMLIGILYSLVFYFLEAKLYKLEFFGLFIIK